MEMILKKIRKATGSDYERIVDIYQYAQDYMIHNGKAL